MGKNQMKKLKDKVDVLRIIRGIQSELAEQFTVQRIGVFGSFAKGDEGPESDVDIIVELAEPTFDHYMDLKFRLEEVLKRPVDLVMADTVKPRIKPIIEREIVYA
jgi:predicted nucleotidyltransferase